MSKTVHISSPNQFHSLLGNSKIVVTDFYADWCGPCKQIAPHYEQLSAQLSRSKKITFAKVNTDQQQDIAKQYKVTSLPTFIIFKNKNVVSTISGADPRRLSEAVRKLSAEAEDDGGSASGGFGETSGSTWLGCSMPKGYTDVTDQVDVRGLDLLNSNSDYGNARILFESSKPSSLAGGKGKGKSSAEESKRDWVESDTDDQLMLFVPFQSKLKIHTLHITSLPPKAGEETEQDEIPTRPKTIRLYTNRANVLGFDEAEDVDATQSITLTERDWDEKTGTAKIELRFVKFQNAVSLVVFVSEAEGGGEKVRVDRIRIVGETGEKRDPGKLEKVDHDE